MSDYHGDIETIFDWNNELGKCGCACYMQTCLEPFLEGQSQFLYQCGFQGDPVYFPDDSDSDSKSEECSTYWRQRKRGCQVSGRSTTRGPQNIVIATHEADYEISTTLRFPHVWMFNPFACKPDVSATVAAGYIRSKSYGIWEYDDDPNASDSIPPPIIGPFISLSIEQSLENYAGQPDPLWQPSGSESENDRPILGPEAQPYWRITTVGYEPTRAPGGKLTGSQVFIDSDTNANGEITILRKATGCNQLPPDDNSGSENEEVIQILEYTEQIDCAFALAQLKKSTHIPWPTEDKSDSQIVDGFDVDANTRGGVGAMFRCSSCNQRAEATRSRYRWRVPPCHPGSYYRIEWDEIFFPKEYLDWYYEAQNWEPVNSSEEGGIGPFNPLTDPPDALPELTPKNYTWMGAALGDCPQLDSNSDSVDDVAKEYVRRYELPSRRSNWFGDLYAKKDGIVEIRNVRVLCYRNPFGSKPQPVFDLFYDPEDVDQDGVLDATENKDHSII